MENLRKVNANAPFSIAIHLFGYTKVGGNAPFSGTD